MRRDKNKWENPVILSFCNGVIKPFVFFAVFIFFSVCNAFSNITEPEYEEIFVSVSVGGLESSEIPAVIVDEKEIYVSIIDVFNYMKIKATAAEDLNFINGFFINEDNTYSVDVKRNHITYKDKIYPLDARSIIRSNDLIFLKLGYFYSIFDLSSSFNFRSLSVDFHATFVLPAVRERRLERMRQNSRHIRRDFVADTTIKRSTKPFRFGAVDWAINAIEEVNGRNYLRASLGLGANVAGGELGVRINYSNTYPFKDKYQHYFWRYVNNEAKYVRQVVAGKIQTHSISTILDPVVGVQISNIPTFRKLNFGSHSYSGFTEPGWTVELYIQNLLIDYTTADAAGFYVFQIPLTYGHTEAELRSYGPWGEEKISKIFFNIPYNFLPAREFEYSVSSGFVQDGKASQFSQFSMNYGVTRKLTVGGGIEYLSSIVNHSVIPYLNTSFSLRPNLLFTGEHALNVRSKGRLTYMAPSNLQVELNHVKYEHEQTAVRFNYTQETSVNIAKPFKVFNVPFFSRASLARNLIQSSEYKSLNLLLSGSFHRVSVNLSTFALSRSETKPFVYSNFSSSMLLPAKVIVTPLVRYVHNDRRITLVQCSVKKNVFDRAILYANVERDFSNHSSALQVGFTYNLSFARVDLSTYHSKKTTSFFQGASGSMMFDPTTNYMRTSRNNLVGTGGIIVSAFLDTNSNGKKDEMEPRVKGLNARGNGGRMDVNLENGTIVISGLQPNASYFLEIDGDNFESIFWVLKHRSYSVMIEPNILKRVDVPVTVIGEVSGAVYIEDHNSRKFADKIKVVFSDKHGKRVGASVSEGDGSFTYSGIHPGSYTADLDPDQLETLQMKNITLLQHPINFEITGDGVVEGEVVFVLQYKAQAIRPDTLIHKDQLNKVVLADSHKRDAGKISDNAKKHSFNDHAVDVQSARETDFIKVDELSPDLPEDRPELKDYRIQIVATRTKIDVRDKFFKGLNVDVYFHEGMFKYTWGKVKTVGEARTLRKEAEKYGFVGAFIVKFYKNERIDIK